jgi:hypothetical protein
MYFLKSRLLKEGSFVAATFCGTKFSKQSISVKYRAEKSIKLMHSVKNNEGEQGMMMVTVQVNDASYDLQFLYKVMDSFHA